MVSLHLGVGVFVLFWLGGLIRLVYSVCFAAILPPDNLFCAYLSKK